MTRRQDKHELLITFYMYLRVAKRVREKKLASRGNIRNKQPSRRSVLTPLINLSFTVF